jgi:hypothetical protein
MNQWLTHAALDMTSTDEVTVWASLLKESDGVASALYEFSGTSSAVAGSFGLFAPISTNLNNFRSGGSNAGAGSKASFALPAPNKSAMIGRSDISADNANLAVNGVDQGGSNAADQGTGNYGNYAGFIGARAGTSNFFKGELFELGIAGKVITDGQLQSLNNRMTRSAKI